MGNESSQMKLHYTTYNNKVGKLGWMGQSLLSRKLHETVDMENHNFAQIQHALSVYPLN